MRTSCAGVDGCGRVYTGVDGYGRVWTDVYGCTNLRVGPTHADVCLVDAAGGGARRAWMNAHVLFV